MNASLKGFLSENAVAHELMARDFEVYKPLVDIYGCDFVIHKNGISSKIQVRSTACVRNNGCYNFHCFHGSYGNIPYESHMIDYFILHLVDIDVYYIIPFADVDVSYISITLNPKNKYYRYKEAWNLLEE